MTDSIRWFRMYGEAVDDEKLRLLAFEDRWHYVALLCCKAQGVLDHGDPLMRRKVAVKLGLAERELDEVSRRLAEVGLIDAETLEPGAWDKRQFKGDQDNTAAERARRYRESKRVTGASRVTEPLRHGCVTRPETETETETETEKKREKKRESTRSPRGSRLPAEFPGDAEVRWCQQERPELDAVALVAKFRDYWLGVAGARGRKADWPATWRNFVRSEFARSPPARAAPNRQDRMAATVAALTGRNEVIDVDATVLPATRLG